MMWLQKKKNWNEGSMASDMSQELGPSNRFCTFLDATKSLTLQLDSYIGCEHVLLSAILHTDVFKSATP